MLIDRENAFLKIDSRLDGSKHLVRCAKHTVEKLELLRKQFEYTLIGCAVLSGYKLVDRSPPLIFELWGSVFWLSVVAWIQTDAQLRRQTPCFDFGWLVWMTAGVSIPW